MRTAISCLVLSLSVCCLAQGNQHPKKILTPEQIAIQQSSKSYYAELTRLRSAVTAAYDAEVSREKTVDCPNASNTRDQITCLSHEMDVTKANYTAFTTALRAILALDSGNSPDQAGPTGNPATPAMNTAAFDTAEAAWHTYSTAECNAMDTFWRGGTIVNSMVGECTLRVARSRLHELNNAYDMLLHH
jgi:uncharacterized protein YecT (DUF1311 family)